MKHRNLRSKKELRPVGSLPGRVRTRPGRVTLSFTGEAAEMLAFLIANGEPMLDGAAMVSEFFGAHTVDAGLPEDDVPA